MEKENELIHENFCEFNQTPLLNNYLKKSSWNSIGDKIITVSEDKIIRIFKFPFENYHQIWKNIEMPKFIKSPLNDVDKIFEQNHIYDICLYFFIILLLKVK